MFARHEHAAILRVSSEANAKYPKCPLCRNRENDNMKKLITLDLDGTLLNSRKEISSENLNALCKAAEEGCIIVPCTGRFFEQMPACVKELPFLEYVIVVNGAGVEKVITPTCSGTTGDVKKRYTESLIENTMTCEQACAVIDVLKEYPVFYDSYSENWGWLNEEMWQALQVAAFANPHFVKMVREYKSPVQDLQSFLLKNKHSVQKVQAFLPDTSIYEELLSRLKTEFPWAVATSSLPFNIEINTKEANKGSALLKLAEILGIPSGDTIACGDNTNDLAMIRDAACGVAMANATDEVKACADFITKSNDEDGIAYALREILHI